METALDTVGLFLIVLAIALVVVGVTEMVISRFQRKAFDTRWWAFVSIGIATGFALSAAT